MARFSFAGGSYQSQSLDSDAQMCMNWYAEKDESGQGKSDLQLLPTPGLSVFATIASPVRAKLYANNRLFAVGGSNFYEVFSDGSVSNKGSVGNDGTPASLVAGPILGSGTFQVLIASAGLAYVYDTVANTLTAVNPANLPNVSQVAYIDGFFIALLRSPGNKLQSSASLDATNWNPANSTVVSVFPDSTGLGILSDHRELWVCGPQKSVVYVNTGAIGFPFEPNLANGYIEQGIGAISSMVRLDNSIFWFGQGEQGNGVFWRAQGYTPQRISTHAIETAIQGYATTSDLISYAYQDQGHSFYVNYFPTANKTWVYDAATGLWHERGFFSNGLFSAHRSRTHQFAFGKHLVGDWNSGNIYQMSIATLTDFGNNIRRVRRAPYISSEGQWIFFDTLEVEAEMGLGPLPPLTDGAGNARDPQGMLRWSDDGAKTWSNERVMNFGQAGNYLTRAREFRLGRAWGSRGRVIELAVTDPIPWRITDVYVNGPGKCAD
jgi:hypothetical protein